MRKPHAVLIIKMLSIMILLFLAVAVFSTRISAEIQAQSKCEQDWCVCEGYTAGMLENDEKNATYDWYGDPISSECFKWFHIWRKYNNRDRVQFLDMAKKSCENCRANQAGGVSTVTPTPLLKAIPQESGMDEQFSEEVLNCEPFKEFGDLDCDSVPDNEDLCLATPGTRDRCGCGVIIAGDLVFRAGLASWATSGPVGDFDFGHVAMFTGDMMVDSNYRNPHPAGTTVLKYDPKQERYVKKPYDASYFFDNDIVVDSIIEADQDKRLNGAYISSLANLVASHHTWSGATSDNLAFGRPGGMTCGQRREAVNKMMYLTQLTKNGLDYSLVNGANCANYVLDAYRYALGEDFLENIDKAFYNYLWPLSPNYLSRHLDLYNLNGENIYRPENAHTRPVVSIGSNMGGADFRNQNAPSDANISWRMSAPVRQSGEKPLLVVFDAAGNLSGETPAGVVTQIPGSEVFSHNGLPAVINVIGQEELLIQVSVGTPADFELVVYAENYPSPGKTVTIRYPKTSLESDALFQVELTPTALDSNSLAMYIYRNGAEYSQEAIIPGVETGVMDIPAYGVEKDDSYILPEVENDGWQESVSDENPLLLIPGILFLGLSLTILLAGIFTKKKSLTVAGLVMVALTVCVAIGAVVFFF